MKPQSLSSARRFRHAAAILVVIAAAGWSVVTLIDNRQRAWALEVAELQSFAPAYYALPASGDLFPGLR